MPKINISIKQKLIMNGVVALLAIVIMFVLLEFSLSKNVEMNHASVVAGNLENEMLTLRRHEKDFLARKDLKYYAKFKTTMGELQGEIANLDQFYVDHNVDRESLVTLSGMFTKYETIFGKLVELQKNIGLDPKSGLYGELRSAVHGVEIALDTVNSNKLMVGMLQLRRAEKDFMLRHAPKYAAQFNASFTLFLNDLQSTRLGLDPAVLTQAENYHEKFNNLVAAQTAIGLDSNQGLKGELRGIVHQTESILIQVVVDTVVVNKQFNADTSNIALFIFVLISAVVGVFVYLITKSIITPINMFTDIINKVESSGNFDHRVDFSNNDEIGQSAKALNTLLETQQLAIKEVNAVMVAVAEGDFKKRMEGDFQGEFKTMQLNVNEGLSGLENAIKEINRVMGQVANNDLTNRIDIDLNGDLNLLKEAINQTIASLSQTLVRIAGSTKQVATASSETSSAIGQISDGAQNQLHAMSQVAAAVKQSSQAVTEVASDTTSASKNAQSSVELVSRSQQKVAQMVDVVNIIASNSKKINKITEVIGGIANKTNMLSLNAAIEAARAGEHGSGFAVVAEEVRKLAEHSANAAQEIAELVDQAVREATNAVATAEEVRVDMDQILDSSGGIEDKLRRIAATMEQQSATMHEITSNIGSMKTVAENSAAASEEITATVVEVSRLADSVRNQLANFDLGKTDIEKEQAEELLEMTN